MVFSTLTFLFAFLPPVFLLYYAVPNRAFKNAVLLLFSLLFYSWGEPKYLFLMLAAGIVAYVGGLLIRATDKAELKKAKKAVFIITVVLITANLFVFKYLNFAAENISRLFAVRIELDPILLPIGISFYTFQILSYVVDLYKGKISLQKNFFYLMLYVSFFPQLIAGPIVRYETVEKDITERKESLSGVASGMRRFIIGLSKKVLIANNVGAVAEIIYSGDTAVYGTQFYWLAAVSYALQIYYDFSGYSDMAIGLGRMFGFRFLENFDHPYASASVTEFWRRWHISLSSWFRDYVYIPLGGNRVGKLRWVLNILAVWALTGFWHGAEWNFAVWGLYYAVLLIMEKLLLGKLLNALPRVFGWMYSMLAVLIGWVIFNMTSFDAVFNALSQMFSFNFTDVSGAVIANTDVMFALVYVPVGIVFAMPWKKWVRASELPSFILDPICLLLLAVCIVFVLGDTYNPFIYFRF